MDQQTLIEQRSKAALIGGDIGLFAAHCLFDICHPVNSLNGPGAAQSSLFAPLAPAFPLGAERIETCITCQFEGGTWTARFGTIAGRIMDLWPWQGALLKEIWVCIDISDLRMQMGTDIFARAAELRPAELVPAQ